MEDQRKVLQWFIDFAQKKIGAVGELTEEEETYLFPVKEAEILKAYLSRSSERRIFEVSTPHPLRSSDPFWWMSRPLPERGSSEYREKVLEAWDLLSKTLPILFHDRDSLRKTFFRANALWEFTLNDETKRYTLSSTFLAGDWEEWLKLRLLNLLDQVPITFLNKCHDCGKIFTNPTFREKKFCSPRCTWRWNTRKWRNAHPKEYKNDQARRMWEKYPVEVREEKKIPNAKIKRRVHWDKKEAGEKGEGRKKPRKEG